MRTLSAAAYESGRVAMGKRQGQDVAFSTPDEAATPALACQVLCTMEDISIRICLELHG